MQRGTHWLGTPRAAGFVAGAWSWAAVSLALHGVSPSRRAGVELLGLLASDGLAPGLAPVGVAVLAVLLHAAVIRRADAACCRAWTDAALSLGLIAAGIAAWGWAVHYEPFADPFSPSRQLAALAGLGAILVGVALTVTAAIVDRRGRDPTVAPRTFRRSYEAIG